MQNIQKVTIDSEMGKQLVKKYDVMTFPYFIVEGVAYTDPRIVVQLLKEVEGI